MSTIRRLRPHWSRSAGFARSLVGVHITEDNLITYVSLASGLIVTGGLRLI